MSVLHLMQSGIQVYSKNLNNSILKVMYLIYLPVNAGVPQGSRLGPLLFLVYINDIVANLESKPYIFADDCTLICSASSTFETTNILSRDLTKISNWAHIWKITFNPQKSKDMIF